MKKILLIIVLIIPFLLSAQEQTEKKNSVNVVAGIAIGSGISKYYQRNKDIFINQGIPDEGYPKTISATVNYRFGFDYQRILIDRLSLKAGVRISNWNLKTTDYFNQTTLLSNLYLEIPVAFQYNLGKKRFKPYIEGGINAVFGLEHNDNNEGFPWTVHIGMGVSYQLSKYVSLYGQLSGRAQVTAKNYHSNRDNRYQMDATGKFVYPYEIGLEFGGAYLF